MSWLLRLAGGSHKKGLSTGGVWCVGENEQLQIKNPCHEGLRMVKNIVGTTNITNQLAEEEREEGVEQAAKQCKSLFTHGRVADFWCVCSTPFQNMVKPDGGLSFHQHKSLYTAEATTEGKVRRCGVS